MRATSHGKPMRMRLRTGATFATVIILGLVCSGCWMMHPYAGISGPGACDSLASQLLNKACADDDDELALAAAAVPRSSGGGGEINVQASSTDYLTGGLYYFGSSAPGTGGVTMTIQNLGTGTLSLIGALTKSGANPGSFTLVQPGLTTITPGGSTSFDVTYSVLSGSLGFVVTIANDDSDEASYVLTFDGCFTC